MKTIAELKEEKLKLRKDNPVYSRALADLLGTANRMAKDDNREITESDIPIAARKIIKQLQSTIDMVDGGPVVDEYKKQVEILKEFLPKTKSVQETKEIVKVIVSENPGKQLKDLIPLLKDKGLEMKIAIEEVKNRLSK